MKPIVDEVARRMRDALRDSIEDFEGLYVFGSQVRGDATDESDVDIVVLFGQHYFYMPAPYYDIMSQMRAEYYDDFHLDVLDYTRDELQRNLSFHDEVVNKGVFYGT